MGSCANISNKFTVCLDRSTIQVPNSLIEVSLKENTQSTEVDAQKQFEVEPVAKYSLSAQNLIYFRNQRNNSTAIKENDYDENADPVFRLSDSLEKQQEEFIISVLEKNKLVTNFDKEILTEFVLGFYCIEIDPNQILYSEKDQALVFYIIQKGSVELMNEKDTIVIKEGQFFGIECFEECNYRVEKATTKEDSKLLCCSRDFYLQSLNYYELHNLNKKIDILKQVPLFKYVDNTKLTKIAKEMNLNTYDYTSILVNEKEKQDKLFIIRSGTVRVTKRCKLIRELYSGDYFCLIDVFFNVNCNCTYSIESKIAECYEIPYQLIKQLKISDMIYQLFINCIKNSRTLSQILIQDYQYFYKLFQLKYYEKTNVIFPLQVKENKKLCLIIVGDIRYRHKEKIIAKEGDIYGDIIIDEKKDLENEILTNNQCVVLEASWDSIVKSSENDKSKNIDLCDTIQKLKRVQLLSELTETQFFQFSQKLKVETFRDQEMICKEGKLAEKFYIIKSGKVKIYQKHHFIRDIDQYGCFGEISFINGEIKFFTAFAEGETECYHILGEDLLKFQEWPLISKIKQLVSLNDTQITLSDLFFVKILGNGRFGKVFLVHNQKHFYAAKYVKISNIIKNKKLMKYYSTEKNLMLQIDHPFIIKLVKTLKNKDYLFYLLEYIDGITLRTYIEKRKKQESKNAYATGFYIGILLIVINYLHTKRILHRDIKPDNCMIDKNGYLKLIDFGIAKELENKEKTYTSCGTPHYLAPEVIIGKGYSYSSDYWSLGITMYELFYGYVPFGQGTKDTMEIYKEIMNFKLKVPYEPQFNDLHSLFKILLSKNIMHRVCNYQLLRAHPFFSILKDFDQLLSFNIKPPYIPDSYVETNANNNGSFLTQCNISINQYINSSFTRNEDNNSCESDCQQTNKFIDEF